MYVKIVKDEKGTHYIPTEIEKENEKNKNWVRIPKKWEEELIDLNHTQRWLVTLLVSYRGISGLICPSLRELSATSGLSLRSVAIVIKRLEELKKIRIFKIKGKYNTYEILC
jgi:hypothetical protein